MTPYTDDELLDLLAHAVDFAYYKDVLTYTERVALKQYLDRIEQRYSE